MLGVVERIGDNKSKLFEIGVGYSMYCTMLIRHPESKEIVES